MLDDYTIISFATKDKPYIDCGKSFEKNMRQLSVPYDLQYINPITPSVPNDRLKNVARKKKDTNRIRGTFIQEMLKKHKKTVIWMDCDDGFTDKPQLPNKNYDVGFVENIAGCKERLPFIAGVIAFRYTNNAFHFLKVWDYLNAWPELEPIGGSHLRLLYARDICFGGRNTNPSNFTEANLSKYILPFWVRDYNRR